MLNLRNKTPNNAIAAGVHLTGVDNIQGGIKI